MAREEALPITKADAVAHCRQAEEYLRAAEHSLAIGDLTPPLVLRSTPASTPPMPSPARTSVDVGRVHTNRRPSSSPAPASTDETSPRSCADSYRSRRNRTTARNRSRDQRRRRASRQRAAPSQSLGAPHVAPDRRSERVWRSGVRAGSARVLGRTGVRFPSSALRGGGALSIAGDDDEDQRADCGRNDGSHECADLGIVLQRVGLEGQPRDEQ